MSRLQTTKNQRLEKLKKLKNLGVNPFAYKFNKKHAVAESRNRMEKDAQTAGRVMSVRGHGALVFMDLQDETGKIQLILRQDNLTDTENQVIALTDIGDIIGVSGKVTKSKTGELSIEATLFQMLTKSIRPLPSQWYGLKDTEERYRQRYLDLLLDNDLKQLFRCKAIFWQSFRQFLLEKGFLEVETPVLENTAGGADANPFTTHHNALDIDLYLRISMGELWQKRLMVAGFEKTFEIGRQFRNEGVSSEHLQDYTQMEFYWAYANYQDSMQLTEEMYKYVAQKTFNTLKFNIDKHRVDLGKPWQEINYAAIILEKTGIDITKADIAEIKAKLKSLKVKIEKNTSKGRLIDYLWKHLRKDITGPVFLTGHPVEVSPLAKRKADNSNFVERFQIIIAGSEIGNGYSELNDPVDQELRFKDQQKARDAGDTEAQMHDRDFVKALEYGMPPVSGFGVSERLFSFLANKSIRETVLFPLLRPEHQIDSQSRKDPEFYAYDSKKTVAVISQDLQKGLAFNALGHLSFSAGHYSDRSWMGKEQIRDASGNIHRGISKYPFIVLRAKSEEIKNIVKEAKTFNGILVVDYPQEMFDTGHDDELVKTIKRVNESKMIYHAVILTGDTKSINKLTGHLKLYKE